MQPLHGHILKLAKIAPTAGLVLPPSALSRRDGGPGQSRRVAGRGGRQDAHAAASGAFRASDQGVCAFISPVHKGCVHVAAAQGLWVQRWLVQATGRKMLRLVERFAPLIKAQDQSAVAVQG